MRKIIDKNYANMTIVFDYSAGTGYAEAFCGGANSVRPNETLWMKPTSFADCKSRDEAELRALMFALCGSASKKPGSYTGVTKNVRLQLEGFTSLSKGLKQSHKNNTGAWAAAISALCNGVNGHTVDLVSIDNTFSSVIENASIYGWKALNHDQNVAQFHAMVSAAKKSAKATRAATAKAAGSARAKTERTALEAKVDAAIAAAAAKVAAA